MIFYEQAQSMKWHVRSKEREREIYLEILINHFLPSLPLLIFLAD